MRIVTYNILDGGEGRADPLAEVIEAQKPDIVALIEATDMTVIERIAARFRMDFIQAVGNRQAVALLSRFPIRDSINHAPLHPGLSKCLLEVIIQTPEQAEFPMGVVHLHHGAYDSDESEREKEVRIVLDIFDRHRRSNRPHMLVGDFNSNSPIQRIDPVRCKHSTRQAWLANGGKIPRRVIQHLLDAGYRDSFQTFDPAAAADNGTFSTQHPGQRVDYAFLFAIESHRIRQARIEYDRLAKYASDHYPICVEIA